MKIMYVSALAGAVIFSACGDDETALSGPDVRTDNVVESADAGPADQHSVDIDFGPHRVANAREGIEKANEIRDGFLSTINVSDYMAMSADERPPQRDAIILLKWDHGPCTDAASLLPSPMEDWGLYWDISKAEWFIDPTRARLTYSYIDQSLEPNTQDYRDSAQSVHVNISSNSPTVQAFRDMISDESLKDVMLAPGPFNYPVQKGPINQTLLGDYLVLVEGPEAEAKYYFEQIVGCGIDNGLIADGVDPASLTATP